MTGKISSFQVAILVIFGIFIVAGVFVFASSGSFNQKATISNVVIWGTLDERIFDEVIRLQLDSDPRFQKVSYVEKDAETFDIDLSEALAAGVGPDLFILSQDSIVRSKDKVLPVSFSSIPKKTFTDTYIDEAQLYLTSAGIVALPIVIDPMVLYYNTDMLSKSGFAQPPSYWDEVFTMAEKMSVRDASGNIAQSTIAFGESANVLEAKNILSMLMMQAGGTIVSIEEDGVLAEGLTQSVEGASERPAVSALRFYTSFANPTESVYSWNRSMPLSRDAFAQGLVGLYAGYASEMELIAELNPNLKYDVTAMPQIRDASRNVTFGKIYGLAIPRTALNPTDAATVAALFAGQKIAKDLSDGFGLPSVRRDLLSQPVDGAMLVFRNAALIAAGWLDPDAQKTDELFTAMISGVTSGSERLAEAVDRAGRSLQSLLQ